MEQREHRKRHKQRKKKRMRRFFLFCSVVLIALAGYVFYQYQQGLAEADGDFQKDGQFEFNGKSANLDTMNVLLLGIDSRGEEHSRADTIMIAHYDKDNNQPKIVSLMRDSYVDIPGYGKNKINAAYAFGGPELLRKTIKENFGIDVNYYAVVDFKGFSKVVDTIAPNGIEVDINQRMSHGIGMTLEPGKQTLHGEELLGYVRFRHDSQSDFGRVQRQQEVLGKLTEEALSLQTIAKAPKLWGIIDPYVDTNVPPKTFVSIGKDFLLGSSNELDSLRIPVDGAFINERVSGAGAVLRLDLEKNRQEIQTFLD
ncbi:LCP family protein [Priestia flexa]|uniref:Regulatory protein MsrR n=3 Tax=Bacillaceae TaxID=186817 RepID=A0A0V8JJN4_9BACI|nr:MULTISPECIES: LCP family protein [Priestia]KSU87246.1 transcriptional regulator [Priestia veravalensis]MBY6087231.1 LCP family protein [Priestia flexa]MCA1203400.1 LCP family protein [Priestia flexa]MCM3066496.1 LCP family protein [Priestia flexa]MDW8517182.1 LCP family protein [Priestia flexa]